jgi:predicted dienelactone hydrolase
MRLFESIQLTAVVVAVLLPVALGKRFGRGRMAGILIAAMVAQLVFEGYRWQLFPLEMATVGLAIGDSLWDERRVRGVHRFRRGTLGAASLVLLSAPVFLLPVPSLPRPSGSFSVGTRVLALTDPDRIEAYGLTEPDTEASTTTTTPPSEAGAPEGVHRRIVVQVWYPTTPDQIGAPASWADDMDVVAPALSRYLGFPGFFLNHTIGLPSNSYLDAPVLAGEFPVIVYSHGWTGFRDVAVDQMEELASHGYIVVAADHTYGAIATRFPDTGEVAYLDPRALPPEDDTKPDDYNAAAETLVETFTDDIHLEVASLEAGPDGPFGDLAEHADLNHLGVYGHSTGGGAAVRYCLDSARCTAVAGLDPWVEPVPDRSVAKEVQMPSMFIRSDGWRGTPNDMRLRGLAERSPSLDYWIGLEGAGHNDFVVTPLFSPIADQLGLKGPIESDRVITIVHNYLVAFFDRYLLGVGGATLDQPPPPEVEFEVVP